MKYNELEEIGAIISRQKEVIEALGKELAALLQAPDDIVVLLYSRRCLETMIIQLCKHSLKRDRGTEPMKGLIDKMYKEEAIPAYIHTSMQNVNNISNYGAHPKEFNPRQVKSTINELATILEWFFDYMKTIPKDEYTFLASNKIINTPEKVHEKPEKQHVSEIKKTSSKITVYLVVVLIIGLASLLFFYNKATKNANSEKIMPIPDTVKVSEDTHNETVPKNKTSIEQPKVEITDAAAEKTPPKETSKQRTITSTKPIPQEELEQAINQLTNTGVEFSTRKKKKDELLQQFDKGAIAEVTGASGARDRQYASDYLKHILLDAYEIKVLEIERKENKISFLKVKEIAKR